VFGKKKLKDVFRPILFHNDVSYDREDIETICAFRPTGASREMVFCSTVTL